MKVQPLRIWEGLRSSFWFLPSLMAAAALVLSFATVAIDKAVTDQWLQAHSWAYTGGAEGASQVLSTVAGSMITIAGVVFSMTLVVLSLASSQLGPRLLRNFMRDTTNQAVLGTFLATFVYCLLVLRTIRRADEIAFVPHLSVTIGVLFGLLSLGVFIYFIHHVSISIQADVVIARVGAELIETIERLFPGRVGEEAAPDGALPDGFERGARQVLAAGDGYLQLVAADDLMAIASKHDLVLRLEHRPGRYIIEGRALVAVWPAERADDALADKICSAFALGQQRTSAQDVEFGVHQLVEIALRALSPGINDPFTAVACVDRLGSAMSRLAERRMPSPSRYDEGGRLRLVAPVLTYQGIADAAFNPIRQHARTSAVVTLRLLEAIAAVAPSASRAADRETLREHAEKIARGASEGLPEAQDRRAVEDRFGAALVALGRESAAADARHFNNPRSS